MSRGRGGGKGRDGEMKHDRLRGIKMGGERKQCLEPCTQTMRMRKEMAGVDHEMDVLPDLTLLNRIIVDLLDMIARLLPFLRYPQRAISPFVL